MSEMIERVATAIWEGEHTETPVFSWKSLVRGSSTHTRLLRQARAVIEAMREPTREMVTSGRRVQLLRPEEYENEKGHFAQAYRYMIDEALK